jgi:5-hydroxyisourate hydrolase
MKIITQVFDTTSGKPAAGVRAHLAQVSGNGWKTVAEAETNSDGRIDDWDSLQLRRGLYRIVFDCDRYFAGLGGVAAYPEVVLIFRMLDEFFAFQVQVTLAPYSYSTFFASLDGPSDAPSQSDDQ